MSPRIRIKTDYVDMFFCVNLSIQLQDLKENSVFACWHRHTCTNLLILSQSGALSCENVLCKLVYLSSHTVEIIDLPLWVLWQDLLRLSNNSHNPLWLGFGCRHKAADQ